MQRKKRMAHIILPTDFSENSLHAGLYAVKLFGAENTVFTLLHAYMDAEPFVDTWPGMADEMYNTSMQAMGDWSAKVRAMPEFAGAVVRSEVLYGGLSGRLNELAEEKHADLVVMGTLGHTGAGLLGSNAGEVVKHCKKPVLVVPAKAGAAPVRRILFADDGKQVEVEGTRMLLQIALRTKAELVLAHVLKDSNELPDPAIADMYEELLQAVPHRFIAAEGEDIAGALDYLADQEGADMISLVHRHTGFFTGLFHKSTAKRLALYTTIPLLVLPQLDPKPGL